MNFVPTPTLSVYLFKHCERFAVLNFKHFYPARSLHFTRIGYSRLDPVRRGQGKSGVGQTKPGYSKRTPKVSRLFLLLPILFKCKQS